MPSTKTLFAILIATSEVQEVDWVRNRCGGTVADFAAAPDVILRPKTQRKISFVSFLLLVMNVGLLLEPQLTKASVFVEHGSAALVSRQMHTSPLNFAFNFTYQFSPMAAAPKAVLAANHNISPKVWVWRLEDLFFRLTICNWPVARYRLNLCDPDEYCQEIPSNNYQI